MMRKNLKNQKGITLIALVITIIILLILAGISIQTLMGENGIINKASIAKEESKKAEYKEELELIVQELQIEQKTKNITDKDYMDEYEEKIRNNERFKDKDAQITRKDKETILVTTKEGYVYKVTKTKVDFIGKQGGTTPPDLKQSDIEGICDPDDWTNGEVQVTVKVSNKELSKYTIQYSLDGKTNWRTYTEQITFKDNGSLFVRLQNELLEFGGATTINVTNIDKIAPQEFTPTVTSTIGKGLEDGTGAITITGYAKDKNDENNQNKCSGVKYYYFKINNSDWIKYDENSNVTTSSPATYTVTGLNSGDKCTIQMKAIDEAGNETITKPIDKYIGYSKNGLIMQYDGIKNTRSGHSNQTGQWEDISSNNNDLVKFGGEWQEDGIKLNGENEYLSTKDEKNPLFDKEGGTPDMTVEVISEKQQKSTNTIHQYGQLLSFGGTVNIKQYMDLWCIYYKDDTRKRSYSIYLYPMYDDISTSEPNVGYGQTNAITYGKSGNKMFSYLNNVTRKMVSGTDECVGWLTNKFYLGRDYKAATTIGDDSSVTDGTTGTYFFSGIIKSVRVYNRALEDWERNDNYDTDCQRYNIK